MDYSIQQLTLIHPSIHSSVYYKVGDIQGQLVIIKVLNNEHSTLNEGMP